MKDRKLYAIGEALIDFIPEQKGCAFDQVKNFSPAVGGAPTNVSAAYAKLGGSSAVITQLGLDPFAQIIVHTLEDAGVDTEYISYTSEANTALAFVSLAADGNRTFAFYRNPSADMLLKDSQIRKSWFEEGAFLHMCSVSLGDFPMKEAHIRAIEYVKAKNGIISFDPNLRFSLWSSDKKLYDAVWEFIPRADILKISDEELGFITGESQIEPALEKLFCGSVKLVIYTCGSNGAYGYTKKVSAFAPAQKVHAVDTTGAGDGFIGAFLWMLSKQPLLSENQSLEQVSEETLHTCLAFANTFCAKSVTGSGAIASYPTIEEMNM